MLDRYVSEYETLPSAQQEAWASMVTQPYRDLPIPVESAFVSSLLKAMESEDFRRTDGFWPVANIGLSVLARLFRGTDSELPGLARKILETPLPAKIDFIPHETLIEQCLRTLLNSGDRDDYEYFLRSESREFWKGRTESSRLSEPSPYLNGEEELVLLTLRARAPMILMQSRWEDAVKWHDEILARTGEPKGYRTLIKALLENIARSMREEASNPGIACGFLPILPDPLNNQPPSGSFPGEELPVLNAQAVAAIQPDLEGLLMSRLISVTDIETCRKLAAVETLDTTQRIEFCRQLRGRPDLPFELKRWVTMLHVLLAGDLDLAEEMEEVAGEWLSRFPTDWPHLPEEWRRARVDEINVNVYLRGYLADVYGNRKSAGVAWPAEERIAKLRAIMRPILSLEDPEDVYAVEASLYFVDLLDVLCSAAQEERIAKLSSTEARDSYRSTDGRRLKAAVEDEQMAILESIMRTLDNIRAKPLRVDNRRGANLSLDAFTWFVGERMKKIAGPPPVAVLN